MKRLFAFLFTPLPSLAVDLSDYEPYFIPAVSAFSIVALSLAHLSLRRMRRYQQRLERSEERLRLSVWGSGDELWDWDISNGQLYRSSSWSQALEQPNDAQQFPPNRSEIHPRDVALLTHNLEQHLQGKTPTFKATYRLRTETGQWLWVLDRGKVVERNEQGQPTRMTGTMKNIQQLKEAEDKLSLFARCLESISDSVLVCDTNFVVLEANPAYEHMTGRKREDILNHLFALPLYPANFLHTLRQKLFEQGFWADEVQERRSNGEVFQAELRFDVIKDEAGQIQQFVAVMSDISERKRREAELDRLTDTDTLTGLPNRSCFSQHLAHLVQERQPLALLVFDLDNFKKINDSLGHELGDTLLCHLAERLKHFSRFKAKSYRLGGDEFAVLLEKTNDIHSITRLAKEILAQINQPFFIAQHELAISCSIGIVMHPEDGQEPQVLLRNADTAMYHAKHEGANRYLFFNDSMNKLAVKRLQIENLIRHGLKEDYFSVFYQPKMDIITGQLVGMEALVRFITPKRGIISPASFIPVAEETGQIVEIGEVVLRKTCADVKAWVEQGLFHGRVAVNLSAKQFMLPFLCEQIDDILCQANLPSYHLELEITEGTVMQSPKLAIDTMKKLRTRGIHLAMDDFGTGYSSLAYLKQFPLNTLKIDKAFVDDMTSARGRNMVDSIVTIAHNLNLTVVAEGVENAEQLQQLKQLRCEIIQGYYYSKPLSASEFEAFIKQQKQQKPKLAAISGTL